MSTPSAPGSRPVTWFEVVRGCIEMTKYRLSSLVVFTTGAGFLLASQGTLPDLEVMLWAMLGTMLSAFGANAFNQCLESGRDQHMDRTRERPIVSGVVRRPVGVAWALLLIGAGVGILAGQVNGLAAGLAGFVALTYVGLYTPLKPQTSLNTLVGAVCGAVPPMIGWAAATGTLTSGAWLLFAIVFVWQIPHFLAIDWYHRDDYARGGFRMASSVDPSGRFSGHLAFLYCLTLLPITLMAPLSGMGGWLYLVGALVLGLAFVGLSLGLFVSRSKAAARRLFIGSLAYLPLLLALLVFDPTV